MKKTTLGNTSEINALDVVRDKVVCISAIDVDQETQFGLEKDLKMKEPKCY